MNKQKGKSMDKALRMLNHLVSFEAAARRQSYTRAGEELFISQAAVSQQMRHLEDKLNIALFVRQGRSMQLTESGRILFEACQKGFREITQAIHTIQSQDIPGSLTVSSTQAFCALWLMPKLVDFAKLQPEITVNVQGSNQLLNLQQGKIDVAIRFSTSTEKLLSDELVVEPIAKDTLYPTCSAQLLKQYNVKEPADLLRCPLIGLVNENQTTWQSWFKHVGIDVASTALNQIEVSSSDLAMSSVLAGRGVMLCSRAFTGPYLSNEQAVMPFDIGHPIHWISHLVYLKQSPKHARIALFCDWIRSEMLKPV